MLFLLVPLHNLTDLNRLLSNNIATALYLGKSAQSENLGD